MATFFSTLDPKAQRKLLDDIHPRIWKYTVKRRGFAEDVADDIVQEVDGIFCFGRDDDESRAWDGKADPIQHAYSIAKNVIYTRRKKKERYAPEEQADEPPASSMRPDKLLKQRRFLEILKMIRPQLETYLEADALCLSMLRLFDQGIDQRAEQAAELGVETSAIKDGWERLKRAMVRVARAYDEKQIREGLES